MPSGAGAAMGAGLVRPGLPTFQDEAVSGAFGTRGAGGATASISGAMNAHVENLLMPLMPYRPKC